jgi:hypothetical protein
LATPDIWTMMIDDFNFFHFLVISKYGNWDLALFLLCFCLGCVAYAFGDVAFGFGECPCFCDGVEDL